MANVRDPFERQHIANLAAYVRMIDEIFRQATQEAASIGAMVQNIGFDESDLFSFEKYPYTKARIDRLMSGLAGGVQTTIVNGINAEWTLANNKNSELARRVFGDNIGRLTQAQYRRYFSTNDAAREAFLARKEQGLNLSERVWNYANGFKRDMELGLDVGIRNGVSADEMSRELRQYLRHPDKLFRRVRDEHGDLVLSKRAQDFHPGQGVYRSSYMNARRLTATETNIAYRTADYERAKQLDFIVGIEVKLSNNHNCKGVPAGMFYDICDELQGRYPKDFKFTGWHPHCYDDKSEVYTQDGWKLFKDVKDDDLILSLNPNTRDLEYVGILLNIKRQHKGRMIHFYNRSYSQLVTPEHEVLCVSKQDGRTFRRIKAEECGNTQPIYRSSEWKGRKIAKVIVGKHNVKYEHFARFMGYWLSDGSLGHKYAIAIAQKDDDRSRIYDCIAAMGMNPRYNGGKIEFNDKEWYEYLRQFGKSAEKFVPKEIKESDKDGIKVFLDAFISCDGHVRKAKPFVGNRGSLCVPTEDERVYFTTSVRMADDIGELILKTGHRPSFKVNHTGGRKQVFRNGEYTINHDVIIISECRSQCATQYKKDIVDYDGMVYDLTLEQNNTMYIRREGKCFWGSNCRCHVETILKTEEELIAENRAILNGEEPSQESVNRVADVPKNFKEWIADNSDRIKRARSIPYFMRDNESWWKGGVNENKMALSKTEVLGGAVLAKEAMDEIRANVKNVSRKIGLFSDTTAINFKNTANGTIMEWDDERLTISTTRFKLSDGTVFCPADDIRMAFKKLNNGKTLTFNEEYSIECLFHESVHAGATKRIDALPGSIGDIIFETCTQLYARERYTKVLKLFNVEALNAEKIRIDGLGYQRECNLLRGIFTKDGVLQIGELKSIANGKADAVKTLELLCKKRGYNFDVIIKMLDN